MALAKLIMLAEIRGIALPFVPLVEAMFNPNELAFSQSTNWRATPTAPTPARAALEPAVSSRMSGAGGPVMTGIAS